MPETGPPRKSLPPDRFVVHRSTEGYRWRYVTTDGRIIAHGSEVYPKRWDCVKAIEIVRNSGQSPVEYVE